MKNKFFIFLLVMIGFVLSNYIFNDGLIDKNEKLTFKKESDDLSVNISPLNLKKYLLVEYKSENNLYYEKNDNSVKQNDVFLIQNCKECAERVFAALTSLRLSDKDFESLVGDVVKINNSGSLNVLIRASIYLHQDESGRFREHMIYNALKSINFNGYVEEILIFEKASGYQNFELQYVFGEMINKILERDAVASKIGDVFFATVNEDVKGKILALSNPEGLVKIGIQSLQVSNHEVYGQVVELLTNNPSSYSMDSLIKLHIESLAYGFGEQTLDALKKLASRQFSGERLNYIDEKLALEYYSDRDRNIIIDILKYSEDNERAQEIILKYRQVSL